MSDLFYYSATLTLKLSSGYKIRTEYWGGTWVYILILYRNYIIMLLQLGSTGKEMCAVYVHTYLSTGKKLASYPAPCMYNTGM